MEDIVISSYKEQLKESALKAEAVKSAGFDIVIDELEKRNIKTTKLKEFFERLMNSNTKEELNRLTPRELSEITTDINNQITRALIVKAEIADALVRKSKIVALSKSPNGKIKDNDNYIRVGTALAEEITKFGIADGITTCITTYFKQKSYQAEYREKIIEKQKELGTYDAEQKEENRRKINARMETEILTTKESPKDKLLKEILKKENISDEDTDFDTAKEKYRQSVNERMQRLFVSK